MRQVFLSYEDVEFVQQFIAQGGNQQRDGVSIWEDEDGLHLIGHNGDMRWIRSAGQRERDEVRVG